jgi:alpha-beta hydrolase superfamily lysophospholipase
LDTSATATWFGHPGSVLAGWWHLPPNNEARAIAVLVPPVGRDYVVTTLSLRLLAEQLASTGIAALRFDLAGTGDSAGRLLEGDVVGRWTSSVREAVQEASRVAGPRPVYLIGLRMGGLLAATFAASASPADVPQALVLWDPCVSGRAFLRESRATRQVALGAEMLTDGQFEGMGLELLPEDAAAVTKLEFPNLQGSDLPTLAMHRGAKPSKSLVAKLGPQATYLEARAQAELLEPEWIEPRAPLSTIDSVAKWLDSRTPLTRTAIEVSLCDTAEFSHPSGRRFTETLVASLAPESGVQLFGIIAEPTSGSRLTVFFLNSSIESHVGPGRMWTDLAREFASRGVRSVRFDLSGIGESGVREGQRKQVTYAPEARDDISAVLKQVCPDSSQALLIGLCSGAYSAVEAGLALRPRQVILINLPARFVPPETLDTGVGASSQRQATVLSLRLLQPLARISWLRRLTHSFPTWLYRLLEGLKLLISPWAPIKRLVESDVAVVLLAGDEDAPPFSAGRTREVNQMRSQGVGYEVLPGLDHAAIRAEGRRQLMGRISGALPDLAPPVPAARSAHSNELYTGTGSPSVKR